MNDMIRKNIESPLDFVERVYKGFILTSQRESKRSWYVLYQRKGYK
jgi:hypothetical protein